MNNLAYTRRLDYTHAGKFMHAHELAQKPQFYFFIFASVYTCMFLFSFFSLFFMLSKLLFHMFNCWFSSHMLELGIYYFDAMNMHDAIGTELLQGK